MAQRKIHPLGLVLCLVAFVWGVSEAVKVQRFVSHAAHANARVTDLVARFGSKQRFAILEYSVNNQNFKIEYPTRADRLSVGESVDVLYDPRNPRNAKRNTFWTLWVLPVVGIGAGILIPLMALAASRSRE